MSQGVSPIGTAVSDRIEEIEIEAKAEGPAAEDELRDLRREFSAEAERMASANRSPGDHSQRRRAPRP